MRATGVARSGDERDGKWTAAENPHNTATRVYRKPNMRKMISIRRISPRFFGINIRWLTWGLEMLKKTRAG